MKSSCFETDELKFVIESKGEQDISSFFIQIEGPETLSLRTTEGLNAFGVKTFSLSENSNDLTQASKDKLAGKDESFYNSITNIRAIPSINKDGSEFTCKNLYLGNNEISCCHGSTACTCRDGCDPPADICHPNVDRCVECYEGGPDTCEPPRDICDATNFRCVECVEGLFPCPGGEACIDGTCQAIAQNSCNNIDANSFTIASPPDTSIQDLQVSIKIMDIDLDTTIDQAKLEIIYEDDTIDQNTFTFNFINNEVSQTLIYGNQILVNKKVKNFRITPIVGGNECTNARKSSNALVCREPNLRCNQDGNPENGQCCDNDCGRNEFVASFVAPDLFSDVCDINNVREQICSFNAQFGWSADDIPIVCSNSCLTGACTFS